MILDPLWVSFHCIKIWGALSLSVTNDCWQRNAFAVFFIFFQFLPYTGQGLFLLARERVTQKTIRNLFNRVNHCRLNFLSGHCILRRLLGLQKQQEYFQYQRGTHFQSSVSHSSHSIHCLRLMEVPNYWYIMIPISLLHSCSEVSVIVTPVCGVEGEINWLFCSFAGR